MITANRPFIPDRRRLHYYLNKACDSAWLTNNGPLVSELTERLQNYLSVQNLLLVANGTIALQVAFKVLEIRGEAITSPFTFVATASAMKWQGIRPRFADIDRNTLTLDPNTVAAALSQHTSAIVPVHVYGTACNHHALQEIAKQAQLKLIYDASHAFGAHLGNQSLMSLGDASTMSFHATKLFHTVEGGAITFRSHDAFEQARNVINFGAVDRTATDVVSLGINGKMSEIHAAFGLANLDCLDQILQRRLAINIQYRKLLAKDVVFPVKPEMDNASYCPILLPSTEDTVRVVSALESEDIQVRRYFHPALHETSEFQDGSLCPVASDTAQRVLCLPVYPDLAMADVQRIAAIVLRNLG